MAVAFDLPGPTFRHERFAEYKATRQRMPDDLRDQFPKVREVVKALRIPVYELAGYEADDVIGTLTVESERRGLDTTIVTGDLDMLQLVTDHTRLMTTRSGVQNTIIYDPERIRERYDLRPDQIVDFKALKGDSTDNVPGVPGVGEKTAAKLINRWETLDALYEHIDEVEPVKLREPLLVANDRVLESRELMRIVRDLPVEMDLDAARLGDYDRETVVRLFREYEFRTLIERLPPLSGERADETVFALRAETADGSFPAAQVAGRRRRTAPARGTAEDQVAGGRASAGRRCSARRPGSSSRWTSTRWARGAAAAPALPSEPRRRPASWTRRRWPPCPDRGSPRRARGTDRRAGADRRRGRGGRARSPVVARGPAGRRRRAAPGRSAPASRDRPRARASPARTVGRSRPTAREPRRRCGACSSRSACPSSVTRSSHSSSRRTRAGQPLPEVAFDTQVAAYLINASLRSQTIADIVAEQLDLILPDPAGLDAPSRAGLDALSAIAARPPLERALVGGEARPPVRRDRAAAHLRPRPDGVGRRRHRPRPAVGPGRGVRGRDLPPRSRDLRRRRPRVQPRQSQAARAGPLLRARPAEGQADEDRLLDRRVGPRGPPAGPPDDRQAPRVADVHEAPLDLRRGAARR